jgi:hypothetical protein
MTDKKPLKKKQKLESVPIFTSAEQIRQSLQAQNSDGVVEGAELTYLSSNALC